MSPPMQRRSASIRRRVNFSSLNIRRDIRKSKKESKPVFKGKRIAEETPEESASMKKRLPKAVPSPAPAPHPSASTGCERHLRNGIPRRISEKTMHKPMAAENVKAHPKNVPLETSGNSLAI